MEVRQEFQCRDFNGGAPPNFHIHEQVKQQHFLDLKAAKASAWIQYILQSINHRLTVMALVLNKDPDVRGRR
jgi:hypothetical protein